MFGWRNTEYKDAYLLLSTADIIENEHISILKTDISFTNVTFIKQNCSNLGKLTGICTIIPNLGKLTGISTFLPLYRILTRQSGNFHDIFTDLLFCTFFILCTHLNEVVVIKWSEFISLRD